MQGAAINGPRKGNSNRQTWRAELRGHQNGGEFTIFSLGIIHALLKTSMKFRCGQVVWIENFKRSPYYLALEVLKTIPEVQEEWKASSIILSFTSYQEIPQCCRSSNV